MSAAPPERDPEGTSEWLRPSTPEQVRDVLRWATDSHTALELRGTGSRTALGRPHRPRHVLDLSGLAGITSYEPDELVLTCNAGTPVEEVRQALAEAGQHLAFEPPLTGPAGSLRGTIGGLVATAVAGPRRFCAGSVRDHVLGVSGVSGFAEAFRGGGAVVKNVTGYDLPKLLTGSFGTLAALTSITLKVMPQPAASATQLISGFGDSLAAAQQAMQKVAASSIEPSAIALLPGRAATAAGLPAEMHVAVRLEGQRVSLGERCATIGARRLAGAALHMPPPLEDAASALLWADIRDAGALLGTGTDDTLWRVTLAPTDLPDLLAANPARAWLADWAGGLLWLDPETAAAPLHGPVGGATLVQASARLRATLPAFAQPQPGVLALTERIKAQFDPRGILNPGRMFEGI